MLSKKHVAVREISREKKYSLLNISTKIFYLLLILAINTAIIDIVVSANPKIGFAELDYVSRNIVAIAVFFPLSILLIKYLKIIFSSILIRLFIGVAFLIVTSHMASTAIKYSIDSLVDKTSVRQQSAAIGAVIAIGAYSNGIMTMNAIGLNGVDKNNVVTKVAATYFIPYLALSGKMDKLLQKTFLLIEKIIVRVNFVNKPLIVKSLGNLCEEAKRVHGSYLSKSNEVTSGFFQDKKRSYAIDFRNKELGYQGTIGLGLEWNKFIRHRDIQVTIREKMAKRISDFIINPQLEYIFPRSRVIEDVLGLFDRKFINPCISFDEYMLEYGSPLSIHYGKIAQGIVINGDWSELPVQDDDSSIGKKAVYTLIYPPIGIMWTLLASVFTFGFLIYQVIVYAFHGKRLIASAMGLSAVLLCLFIPLSEDNKSEVDVFNRTVDYLSTHYEGRGGTLVAYTFAWSTKVAPVTYPLGYFSREYLVGVIYGIDKI